MRRTPHAVAILELYERSSLHTQLVILIVVLCISFQQFRGCAGRGVGAAGGSAEDCRRTFPAAAVLGGACDAVVRRLGHGRAGIETLLVLDSSRAMLQRVARQQREQQVRRQAWKQASLPEKQLLKEKEPGSPPLQARHG